MAELKNQPLAMRERDACGIGAVVSIDGTASYNVVDAALKIVEKLEHRAGKDATGETGDGVGVLMQISHRFFSKVGKALGLVLGDARDYGIGMFFLPSDTLRRKEARTMFELIARKAGVVVLGWREVPVDAAILGKRARDCMPCIAQCFLARPASVERGLAFDRILYCIRREFEQSAEGTYIVSLSSRTIVYKGMFLVGQLRRFFPDLQDPDYESALAIVHSRFSTNTNPSWERAHPYRFVAHNGEINTIRGNIDRMLAREETMYTEAFGDAVDRVLPVVNTAGSDSAMLDNTLEFLVMSGMDMGLAMTILIPEPWKNDPAMDAKLCDFYRYWATMMEPWDGPAAILFTDGDTVGAILDRNGLRPSRYYVTQDRMLILSSEVGVLDIPAQDIVEKNRLRPGKLLLCDTVAHCLISDEEAKAAYAARKPYGEWLARYLEQLDDLAIPNKKLETHTFEERGRLYRAFGYTYEDIHGTILPMARDGREPIASMGNDIPLAVLSEKHQPLFRYFKQLFAQVTNPPIDSLREEIVTDTAVYAGSDGNLLEERPENCRVLEIESPILTGVELAKIRSLDRPGFKSETVSLLYYVNTSLERALDKLFVDCDRAYRKGANILILSDRGVDENRVAIPSLLAVSAMEQYLVRTKKRTAVSIILESAEPREVHHFATLLGYGARAIYPYLAHECIASLIDERMLDKDYHTAIHDYNEAILHGVVKIAAKMGVSTLQSYQSAQIFEAIGIRKDVIDRYFTNTISRVEGIGLEEIAAGVAYRHDHAFDPLGLGIDTTPDSIGFHQLRRGPSAVGGDKEDHMYNPETIIALQQSTQNGDYKRFKEYSALVDDEGIPHTLRGLLEFAFDLRESIPLEEVEPASEIVKRFKTGAMSYGSISQEAHECLAIAMNRLGGKSNSGEGGESPERLGTEKGSAIKQVASGRFGVTSAYLASAKEIQIKMAQGAKPGEGGHLPGAKVYPWIARTRGSSPGVALISPPPHHDIYSIEDLAELIYDLKNANTAARITVKLVSEAGVGTIAAGVAKAGAEVILISGDTGGTGAAPQSSIHNAGLPWELGVAETHRTLIENGLRSRVRIETDGKLMTGRDVAIAAMLGAEEFGFATAPLVTMGCMMMRVCNLDTCPFGIATQNAELRKRFHGKPEYVMNFMLFIAEELREILAKFGLHTMDELVGRTDLLRARQKRITKRAETVDLSGIVDGRYANAPKTRFEPADRYDFHLERTVDESVLLPHFASALKSGRAYTEALAVSSTDRAFGTILGSAVTRRFGNTLAPDTFTVRCTGGGGQSFGAFIPRGLTITLEGDANDGFGKGLSGGRLILCPPKGSTFRAADNIIVGNVALYGATSGEAYISGVAGERFCVRNSGAEAVVEGCGDHGCEYMTGGIAVILGRTGKNFAAGMSGGVAYVLDTEHTLYRRLNRELVEMDEVREKQDILRLKSLIERHVAATGSVKGQEILDRFADCLPHFKRIIPTVYRQVLEKLAECDDVGTSPDAAALEAFHSVSAHKEG
ncbi:MAG: glutamate synthase large subunit [Clostridiaceae bacterium]|nr:glutamate synthase large subunit [Clostridiaceae bacterium]